MALTEYLLAGTANGEWNASRYVTLTKDGRREWGKEEERRRKGKKKEWNPFQCHLSCLVFMWHLGLASLILSAELTLTFSSFFLVSFFISHSPDSSTLFFFLHLLLPISDAPHSNTCSLLFFSSYFHLFSLLFCPVFSSGPCMHDMIWYIRAIETQSWGKNAGATLTIQVFFSFLQTILLSFLLVIHKSIIYIQYSTTADVWPLREVWFPIRLLLNWWKTDNW